MNTNITQEQMDEMFSMQDAMNKKVNVNWAELGHDWELAGHMEMMEGVDHWGYKWWKHTVPDKEQVQLEVVDTWHFYLSHCICAGVSFPAEGLDTVEGLISEDKKKSAFIYMARNYATLTANQNLWAFLLYSVDLTPKDLYEMYIKKNVLNTFRQDNGYKTGEYIKIWDGEEDNVRLLELSDKLLEENNFSKDTLYTSLAERYAEVS